MEISKEEIVVLESVEKEVAESQIRELADLQLCLVGGGIGSVIFG